MDWEKFLNKLLEEVKSGKLHDWRCAGPQAYVLKQGGTSLIGLKVFCSQEWDKIALGGETFAYIKDKFEDRHVLFIKIFEEVQKASKEKVANILNKYANE